MEFRKYEKIFRLGKYETDGILKGNCVIQEKIDGANASIWKDSTGIQCGSRNRHLKLPEEFNGFVPYALCHKGIASLLQMHPSYRLYGEWLVKHTIAYNEEAYKQFYLFDVLRPDGKWASPMEVQAMALEYGINHPKHLATLIDPTYEQLKEYVGQTSLGDRGEGIVIKNADFINTFGDRAHAKVVSESFKEDNGVAFNSNDKYADHYWELYIANKYITMARVQKIINKLQPVINERLDMKHIPRICESVYHDMITEDMYEIQKKAVSVTFKALQRICFKKAKAHYVQYLESLNA